MNAKAKMPKISEIAASEIADAARKAYSNGEADNFFEEITESVRHYAQSFNDEESHAE